MSDASSPPDDPGARIEELLQQQGLGQPTPRPEPQPAPSDPLERILADARPEGEGERPPADGGSGADEAEAARAKAADTVDGAETGTTPGAAPPDDPFPDAPLFALLRTVERDVGVDRIDHIWVFPPRRMEAGETAVVVVAAFHEIQDDRRRVYAAHYTAPAEAREPRLALQEYGTAPTERVGRLVEDVVERLKDQPAAPPRAYRIEGTDTRWLEALHELAEKHLEEVEKNPRLRR